MFRRTKIVATVGPASDSDEQLQALLEAGVNVFRLNFSHGDLAGKAAVINRIRAVSQAAQQTVAILADLQGPKIRTGLIEGGSMPLTPETEVTITTHDILGAGSLIPTTYPALPQCVTSGDQILLDDGLIALRVIEVEGSEVRCQVECGGLLKDRKGINLPGAAVAAPCLTEKDLADLQFCLTQSIDYIALSFVRRAEDVLELKRIISDAGRDIPVVAKIEKPQAVAGFDSILEVSDAIMVARGDLGVEMNPEQVPLVQKQIIRKCNKASKPVIIATQMLESMIEKPRPTRAEISDIANAIIDGTDAVMLSAETASGKYPVEAVSLMVRVAYDVESDPALRTKAVLAESEGDRLLSEAIGQSACRVAECIGAQAILAFTQTGSTASLVAKYRPRVPIYAVTPSVTVKRRLALYAGVHPFLVELEGNTETQIQAVCEVARSAGLMQAGDVAVITMGSPSSSVCPTNLMKVHRLDDVPAKECLA